MTHKQPACQWPPVRDLPNTSNVQLRVQSQRYLQSIDTLPIEIDVGLNWTQKQHNTSFVVRPAFKSARIRTYRIESIHKLSMLPKHARCIDGGLCAYASVPVRLKPDV